MYYIIRKYIKNINWLVNKKPWVGKYRYILIKFLPSFPEIGEWLQFYFGITSYTIYACWLFCFIFYIPNHLSETKETY